MNDLQAYYNARVKRVGEDNQLEQVGHTIAGQAISSEQFSTLTRDMISLLQLSKTDTLLDLGCGNGVITAKLAEVCDQVWGVDFSSEMVRVAKLINNQENIAYVHADVFDLTPKHVADGSFSKVLMYGALQHIKPVHFEKLVTHILTLCEDSATLVFGFVPNANRKWQYYNTTSKKLRYFYYKIIGRDVMGTWWSAPQISRSFEKLGMDYEIIELKQRQYGYPYRFHVVAKRQR